MSFAGVVLAGGESHRMGTDKAFIAVEGVEMVARAAQALADADALSVTIIGGDQARITALGLTWVADRFPGEGPLGGIITALSHVASITPTTDRAVILACDLIRPSPDAVKSVLAALNGPTADVAVPAVDGYAQWMHAAWRVRSLDALTKAFVAGVRAPRHAIAELIVKEVVDADPGWFADADFPDDLPPSHTPRQLGRYDLPAPQED